MDSLSLSHYRTIELSSWSQRVLKWSLLWKAFLFSFKNSLLNFKNNKYKYAVQASKNAKGIQGSSPSHPCPPSTPFLSCPEGIFYICTSQYKKYSFLFLFTQKNMHKRVMYHTHCSAPFFLHVSWNCLISIHTSSKYSIIWMCQMYSTSFCWRALRLFSGLCCHKEGCKMSLALMPFCMGELPGEKFLDVELPSI